MKRAAIGGLVLLTTCWANMLSACGGPFPIGERSRSYLDATRERTVGALLYYPATGAGNGAPAVSGCAFPILSFGHGFTIPADRYRYLVDGLVPRGYVLVFPTTESGLSPSHAQFGLDLAFLPRAVAADPDFTAVVGAAVAVGGHSMGGGASVLAARAPAVGAWFGLAPAETNPSAIAAAAEVGVPALILTGSRDCVTPAAQHAQPIYTALATVASQKRWVDLDGASHCQFSDGYFTCSFGESSCGGGATISAAQQHQRTLAQLLPWLEFYVRGSGVYRDGFE